MKITNYEPKYSCSKCREMAIWKYAPKPTKNNHYCDACVSRGCSCNMWGEMTEELVDEMGRFLPCCEYVYSEEGFDKEPNDD